MHAPQNLAEFRGDDTRNSESPGRTRSRSACVGLRVLLLMLVVNGAVRTLKPLTWGTGFLRCLDGKIGAHMRFDLRPESLRHLRQAIPPGLAITAGQNVSIPLAQATINRSHTCRGTVRMRR